MNPSPILNLDDCLLGTTASMVASSISLCSSSASERCSFSLLTTKYRLQKGILGSGSFSTTRCAIDTSTNLCVAMKMYSAESLDKYTKLGSRRCSQKSELYILQRLIHPNVVSLLDVVFFENSLVLVLEYLDGGDLYNYIQARKFLTEPCAVAVLHPCLQALAYVHGCSVCHRDVKPENILFLHKAVAT